jgi:GntP family gluconate:H+ symporter
MEATISYAPMLILLFGTLCVVLFIVALRLPAYISLILGAIIVGILSPHVGDGNTWVSAVETAMKEFGITAGKVSFVIAIASVLGVAMTESGAAERIVNQLIKAFGESRAGVALLVAGFILSIPVFFDTVFFLLMPLALVLAQKTGKHLLLFVMAISCGAVITHSIIPPTPGPLLMAEAFNINLGLVIVAGLVCGIIPAYAGYKFAQRQDNKITLLPPSLSDEDSVKPVKNLPSFGVSMLPIILPLLLIIAASVMTVYQPNSNTAVAKSIAFVGNKNVAMFLGLIVALYLWAKNQGFSLKELGSRMERPLEIAGLIILITSAGGAFGAMISKTGLGDMINAISANGFSMNLIVVAWAMAVVIKLAQGSGTVSVITTAGIMAAIVGSGADLPYHPIYLFMAIGYGSMVGSWMNDSGFWIVGKLSGMTEQQIFRSWTMLLAVIGTVGFVQALVMSYILPLN